MELETIRSMIYEVRGVRVMLDFDLARLYQVENRTLKRAVRRNMDRFPGDFMLKLTKRQAGCRLSLRSCVPGWICCRKLEKRMQRVSLCSGGESDT